MEIKIGKSARHCAGCSREFVHEEPLYSVVRLEEQCLMRDDFCEACWRIANKPRAFSVWHSRYYDPRVAEQEPPEVFSPLRQVFYEAVGAHERLEMAKAYLAAHLLRRQKVFRLIKESDGVDDELSIALFSDRIGNRLIEVRDPSLSHDELEAGRVRLLARLKDLEDGTSGPADASEPVDDEVGDVAEPATLPEGAADNSAMEYI